MVLMILILRACLHMVQYGRSYSKKIRPHKAEALILDPYRRALPYQKDISVTNPQLSTSLNKTVYRTWQM